MARPGFEPTTSRSRSGCSTTEPAGPVVHNIIQQFFRCARADNSGVGVGIWPKCELIQALCMSSLPARMRMIDSKMKELECSQDFSHYKSMGIFPDAQGQLTPQSLVQSGRISNSSEMS